MRKFNKFIITALCSLMLVCSLTVFTSNKNIVKADTNLTRNQIATLIYSYLAKIGVDFSFNGFANGSIIISTFATILSAYETDKNVPQLQEGDFILTDNKEVELTPTAVNYTRGLVNYLEEYYNLSNNNPTSLISNTGYYADMSGSLIPVAIQGNYDGVSPLLTVNPSALAIGQYENTLFSFNGTTYTANINKNSNGYTYISVSTSNDNLLLSYNYISNCSLYLTYINDDYYLYLVSNPNNATMASKNMDSYLGDAELIYLNRNISATYDNSISLPAFNDYGALVLNNTTGITTLSDYINTLNTAIYSGDLSDAISVGFGQTFADALNGVNTKLNEQVSLLTQIKNVVNNIYDTLTDNLFNLDFDDWKPYFLGWVEDLTDNLQSLNTNDSNVNPTTNIKNQITSLNSSLLGGFVTVLNNNGLGIIIFMSLVLILLNIVL